MWPVGPYGSVLFERENPDLRQTDWCIRWALTKGALKRRWTPPAQESLPLLAEGRALLRIYKCIYLSHQNREAEALGELRQVFAETRVPQLRARALQFLVQNIFMRSINERAVRNIELADTLAMECRDLCEVGFRDLSGYKWSKAVRFSMRAALGCLDYYSGDGMTASLHLKKALEDYGTLQSKWDRANQTISCVYLCLGNLAYGIRDYSKAQEYYRRSAKTLPYGSRVSSYAHLACALLKGGRPRQAIRVIGRGLREALIEGAPQMLVSQLREYRKEANALLSKRRSDH
jgi:tetratricopeptide (TPR) repeat protein